MYESNTAPVVSNGDPRPTLATALREALAERYSRSTLVSDILAGITVGIIALPLSMALAIASGVPPQHGLYTAIVAGAVVGLLGGSRTSVSGPTAAFVVILAPITAKFGLGGLLMATLMAGFILLFMGIARMGRMIQYIPHPVTTGFTSGIAVVIASLQIKDFFGLQLEHSPESFFDRMLALLHALPSLSIPSATIGVLTLAILIILPRLSRAIPPSVVAVTAAALLAVAFSMAGYQVDTIGSRFSYVINGETLHGIPQVAPMPGLPWNFTAGEQAAFEFNLENIRALVGPATVIALLGAIESLLCAVVADGITNTKHNPDTELIALGVGNIAASFFGGIAATGAIARTAANIRAGARSPIAAIVHAGFVLAAVLALAPLLAYLPMASLAALLFIVAWNMSEAKHFLRMVRIAPKSDVTVLATCFALTVVFDMVVSVTVGVVLAAILFMRRMAAISSVEALQHDHPRLREPLPPDALLYDIAGPLFFGAAERASTTLHDFDRRHKVIILHMGNVPAMDVTGLVALKSALDRYKGAGCDVIMCAVRPQPRGVLDKAGIRPNGKMHFCDNFDDSRRKAWELSREAVAPVTEPALNPAG